MIYAALDESHAAAAKHTVMTLEKTIGMVKKYLQLMTVMAAKQNARVQAVPRMNGRAGAERLPNCHARTAARRNKTLITRPNPT
jgi:hypothetical protein